MASTIYACDRFLRMVITTKHSYVVLRDAIRHRQRQHPPIFNAQRTLIPVTDTPTSTATPDVRIRVPGGQGFYGSTPGALLQGFVPIIATAVNNFGHRIFDRYELYIPFTGAEEWSLLTSKKEQYWQDSILCIEYKCFARRILRFAFTDHI